MCLSEYPHRPRRLALLGASLVGAVGGGVVLSPHSPAYAQMDPLPIPDLRGNWSVVATMVAFENSFDATEEPKFQRAEARFTITHQQDHLIAGNMPAANGTGERMMGVVLPDGTVSMQMMDMAGGHDRIFLTATLMSENGRYRMAGYGHMFEDLDQTTSPTSGSLQFTAIRDE